MFDNPWAYRLSIRPSYISSLKNTTDVSVRFCNCECFLILLLIMFFHRAPLSISLTLCIENICLKLLCEYYILNSDASILTNSSITFVPFSVNIATATVPRHFWRRKVRWRAGKRSNPHIFRCFRVEERLRDNFMAVQHLDYTGWLSKMIWHKKVMLWALLCESIKSLT